ncbi:MAG: CoA-binding protein, partial [Syntrophales bacterium]
MNDRLQRFFSPGNVAVVGASTKNMFFANMVGYARKEGVEGRFFPVNPGASEVCGIPTVQLISQLPEDIIDFAAVIVKSSTALATLDELAGRGIKNILLISGGFAESGDEGGCLQEDLKVLCHKKNILLLGPNYLGFMNIGSSVSVFAGASVEGELVPGAIGIIAQSGAASEAIATKVLKKGLGISLYVTTGNEALLTSEDCMEYMIESGTTRVIIGFMEGFRDIPRMRQIALDAARRKIPIILIKIGRSEKSKQAARSHTGALAGDASVMEGFFRQYGIIRVETIEELVETAGIFSRCHLPNEGRVGICTMSGGFSGLYADLCSRLSIEIPDLSPETVDSLKRLLPDFAQPANPLDVTGSGWASGMDRVIKILLADERIDILMPISFPPSSEMDVFAPGFNESFLPLIDSEGKPIIPITFREVNDYARKYYRDHGAYFIEHAEDGF